MKIRTLQFIWRNANNAPYLSGDSIAQLCDYTVQPHSDLTSRNLEIEEARSLFVYGDVFEEFLDLCGDRINAKTIVVGNSDVNFNNYPNLPEVVELFLAQNAAYTTSLRYGILPIGLENLKLGRLGNPNWYREQDNFPFEDKVLVPPMSPTNPIRRIILESPSLQDNIFVIYRDYLTERKYFDLVRKYRFILALEGNGYENHRVWESLYQNSFPVLLRTPWSSNIKNLGIPVLLVNDISEVTLSLLESHLDQNQDFSAADCPILWTPYWKSLINREITA